MKESKTLETLMREKTPVMVTMLDRPALNGQICAYDDIGITLVGEIREVPPCRYISEDNPNEKMISVSWLVPYSAIHTIQYELTNTP